MTQYVINLLNEPNQKLSVDLESDDGEAFSLDLQFRTLPDGILIANIDVNGNPERQGVVCCDKMPLIANNSLKGNLYFADQYGDEYPRFTEFNDRFLLIYDTEYRL